MATGGEDFASSLLKEFEKWQSESGSETIFMLESRPADDGAVNLCMLLDGEHEFKLLCPAGYPHYEEHFYVEGDPKVILWANALNEYLLDSPNKLSLTEVLNKAVSLYSRDDGRERTTSAGHTESEEDMDIEEEEEEEEDPEVGLGLSDDDSAFTTEWELSIARKKKRWAQKEVEIREELKAQGLAPGTSDMATLQATGQEKEQARQIFTSTAASGILTNDLIGIMEQEQSVGFTAEPVEDNIYQWCVKLYRFCPTSDLAADLEEVNSRVGYNYIELQLDFAIDLYPFYPPLVKVIRPRLQGSMMQRVTNMEMLKLSYWNPAKDMCSVLVDIKAFLQQWARLEVSSERNDPKRFPCGSYVDIEHDLLRLALVSEVNPRANIKYHMDVERPPDAKPSSQPQVWQNTQHSMSKKKKHEEYWAAGVGYGHSKRPEWDIKAFLAAQREKDKQIESVLHKILQELKKLYANHAPQLKPRGQQKSQTDNSESIDPVEDMYNILEGSALVPFIEQYFRADSFLEICRHTTVYKITVDIVKEIAMQPQLLSLMGRLPDQQDSVYNLLKKLEERASVLIQHICKAGNGSIPKPPKKQTTSSSSKKGRDKGGGHQCMSSTVEPSHSTSEKSAEERLAREFQILFRDLTEAFTRAGISPDKLPEFQSIDTEAEVMEINICTDEDEVLEAKYRKCMKDLLFDTHEMEVEGSGTHHYANEYKKQPTPSQSQVFRIAQDITSLSSSLPLDLSSAIFVRTDDEKLTLMRALITGPEGTPYSNGCFHFDVFFPSSYPKAPPMVNLQTTGGGTVRFNPNLYNCGKVCLSLLGTWEGQQGEQWNETTSTVLQVLVSIQSLILVMEPYFNEPGYEQEIGTDAGKRHSAEYNADVRINNIKYAMIAQLQNPSPGFEDVVKTHFYLKKDKILQEVEGWLRTGKSSKLERAVQNLRTELQKLEPPPNVVNLCGSSTSTEGGPQSEDV